LDAEKLGGASAGAADTRHAMVPAAPLNLPTGHDPLHDADARPGTAPYKPTAHETQAPAPELELYRPAGQVLQAAAPVWLKRPAGLAVPLALVEPDGHAKPGGQLPLHAALARPGALPKVPSGQLTHGLPPPSPYCPVGHRVPVLLGLAMLQPLRNCGHAAPSG
jgi:hypothetical protein